MQHVNHPVERKLLNDKAYKRLLERHEALEEKLVQAQSVVAVDWDGVKLIKRDKLRVAEAMEALRRTQH